MHPATDSVISFLYCFLTASFLSLAKGLADDPVFSWLVFENVVRLFSLARKMFVTLPRFYGKYYRTSRRYPMDVEQFCCSAICLKGSGS